MKLNNCAPCKPTPPILPIRNNFIIYDKYKTIYHDIDITEDCCPQDVEAMFKEWEEVMPKTDKRWWEITLQDILDLAPPNASPSNIKLNIEHRYDQYKDIKYIYAVRNTEKEEASYQKEIKRYENELDDYNKKLLKFHQEMIVFNEESKKREIYDLEARLSKLKIGLIF